jgi:hypothetical protein
MRLHLLLLRSYQQEVEDDKDQQQRHDRDEQITATARRRLGEGRRNQHRYLETGEVGPTVSRL